MSTPDFSSLFLTRDQVRDAALAWIAAYRSGHTLPAISPQVCAAIDGALDRTGAPDTRDVMRAVYACVIQ